MRMRILVLLVTAVMLSGCMVKTPGKFFAEFTPRDRTEETRSCMKWLAQKEQAERAAYNGMDSRDKAETIRHKATMDTFAKIMGKGENTCSPGTNEWDAYIAAVHEDGQTNRAAISEGGSTVRFVAGVAGATYAVTELAAKAGDKVLGNKTTAGRDSVDAKTDQGGDIKLDGGINSDSHNIEHTSQVQAATTESPNTITKTTPAPAAAEVNPAETAVVVP